MNLRSKVRSYLIAAAVLVVVLVVLITLRLEPMMGISVARFLVDNWLPAAVLTALLVSLLAVWKLPKLQVRSIEVSGPKESHGLENEARKTLAAVLGGAILICLLLFYVWHSVEVERDRQISALYLKGVELIASEKVEVRVGAIYAFDKIAEDSGKDRGRVVRLLAAFVREKAPWSGKEYILDPEEPPKPPDDIQAALTVIGAWPHTFLGRIERRLDLSGTDLVGADLSGAHLEGVDFTGSHMELADLSGAILNGAVLTDANLRMAKLERAELEGAKLEGAVLKGAVLRWAALEGAELFKADCESADFSNAVLKEALLSRANLRGARLTGADLEGAYLWMADLRDAALAGASLFNAYLGGAKLGGADLSGADVGEANFEKADLRGTKGVTVMQISLAKTLLGAKLDKELRDFLATDYHNLFDEPLAVE